MEPVLHPFFLLFRRVYSVDELNTSRSPQPSASRFPAAVDLFVDLLDAFFAAVLPLLDDFADFPRLDFAMVTAQSSAEGVSVNNSLWGLGLEGPYGRNVIEVMSKMGVDLEISEKPSWIGFSLIRSVFRLFQIGFSKSDN
jgi:hypothetical protein